MLKELKQMHTCVSIAGVALVAHHYCARLNKQPHWYFSTRHLFQAGQRNACLDWSCIGGYKPGQDPVSDCHIGCY